MTSANREAGANRRFVLSISCPDQVGIVAAVSGFLAQHRGWIVEANHHSDQAQQRFFMRHEILADSLPFDHAGFCARFADIAARFHMEWNLSDTAVRKRAAVLVSRHDHCLADLLYRWRTHELDFDLIGVVSNHTTLREFVEWHGVPFHHVPLPPADKGRGFAEIETLLERARVDLVVLARFMQILPAALCGRYPNRIINIHHSFLPSFAGARPYHQAFQRGVKLIGATCHYVTPELDAGPIIEQDAIRVDHDDTVEDMVRYGRDIEKMVLARGLGYHLQDRVLVSGAKTVVFK